MTTMKYPDCTLNPEVESKLNHELYLGLPTWDFPPLLLYQLAKQCSGLRPVG